MITEKLKLLKTTALSQTHKLQRQYPRNKCLLMNQQVESWAWTSYTVYNKRASAILVRIKREPVPLWGGTMGLWKWMYPSYSMGPIQFRVMHNALVHVLEKMANQWGE